MIRVAFGILGILTWLFPDRILDLFEALAIENPQETHHRDWIATGVRAEGITVAAVSLIGGRAFAWMLNLMGVFGAIVLLAPRLYRIFATRLLYSNPDDVEWNDSFRTVLRAIGVFYVIVAVLALHNRRKQAWEQPRPCVDFCGGDG